MFETSEKKDDELWNEIFNEVDVDGDGEITFEEFKIGMTSVLAKETKDSRKSDKVMV